MPVVCAGQLVFPGDVIAADDDGVVVIPRTATQSVMEKTQTRLDAEEDKRLRLKAGELGLDLYNMRPRLAEAGLEYVDDLETLGSFNGIDCRNRG